MANHDAKDPKIDTKQLEEARIEHAIGEELTDEQLLQMAEGSCSWGANCNRSC